MTPRIILIHPPVVKPSEPPAGIAKLSACLTANRVEHRVLDANLEGMLFLTNAIAQLGAACDRWSVRACKNLDANLAALRNSTTFSSKGRYSRAVLDVNRVLTLAGKPLGVRLSLSDYADDNLSPVKTTDLIQAADKPEANPFYPYFAGRLREVLTESPEVLGFSLNFLSQALCTMAMIGFIKKVHPRQKIILGGSLTTSWMQITGCGDLFSGLVDQLVAGAGEETLLTLLGIDGAAVGPSANYDLFTKDHYLAPGFILPYSAARGCWWHRCAFCPEKAEANPYLPQATTRVVDELQTLSRETHPSLIHLLDSSIAPAVLRALAEKPPGAPWYGFVRVTRHLADEDFCRSLKAGGCVMLKLGIESGDQAVLDALNKGVDLTTASVALKTLRKAGIATYCYFLFGTPPETEASAMKTLEFAVSHADDIDFLNLAIFNLSAASTEAQGLTTQDFYEGDLSLYKSFHHPGRWQRPAVRTFLEKTFKKHSSIAPIVARTPELFTSNHAPFFTFLNK